MPRFCPAACVTSEEESPGEGVRKNEPGRSAVPARDFCWRASGLSGRKRGSKCAIIKLREIVFAVGEG